MALQQQAITIAEFERFLEEHPEGLYELVNGEIREKLPTERHGEIAVVISSLIHTYLSAQEKRFGRVSVEARFRPAEDETNDLLPDVSFRRTEGKAVNSGPVQGVPDLAVEIKSPKDKIVEMRQKAQIYLTNGAAMVWLVYPDDLLVEVYTPQEDVYILQRGASLSGGDVLPGFSVIVDTIFAE